MNRPFASLASRRESERPKREVKIPSAVIQQRQLRRKYPYRYHLVTTNGNIENNSTLYVKTDLAHHHQIEQLFNEAILDAKTKPEIFGSDFECTVQINLVRKYPAQYVGYAFVDLDNPKLYYALVGCNVDGSERVEYIPDPTWIPPKHSTPSVTKSLSWADDEDDIPQTPVAPRIRKQFPPILTLGDYPYDSDQLEHIRTHRGEKNVTRGTVTISPAFVTPGVDPKHDDTKLYVNEIPATDYDFLYAIFSRYARHTGPDEDDFRFYPKITIHESKGKLYAIVKYSHPYDTKFAITMLKKIRARYNEQDVNMTVRPAFKNQK